LDLAKGHRKAMELGIPLPVVDKCRNMFIASVCLNGNLNTMRFGLKVHVATGKALLRRAMRLSKLLSKYKSKFATVIGSFFSELQKTTSSGGDATKSQKDAYHFAKQAMSENYYYYDDYDEAEEDEGLFDYDELDLQELDQMEYDAMSAEFYAEFGLMSFDEFDNDENWDTLDVLETNEDSKVVKKCRKTLGLNWCYCQSNKIGIPFACFGNEQNDEDALSMQVSQAKQLVTAAENTIDDEFYYEDAMDANADDYYYGDENEYNYGDMDMNDYYYDDNQAYDDGYGAYDYYGDLYDDDYTDYADEYYYDALLQNYYQNLMNYETQLLQNYYTNLYNNAYQKVLAQQQQAAALGAEQRRRRTMGSYNDNRDTQRILNRQRAYLQNEQQFAADEMYDEEAQYDDEYGGYGYYEDLNFDDIDIEEEAADEENAEVQDQWFDDNDGMSWSVSNELITDYDTKWDQDEMWDEITPSVTTIHGNVITRKCLHMWGKRLCLCQFLNWIDSRRYKCLPTAYMIGHATPVTVTSYQGDDDEDQSAMDGGGPYYNDVGVWHHTLPHKPAITGIDSHIKYREKHTNKPNHKMHKFYVKETHKLHRKGVRHEQESSSSEDEAREVLNGDYYDYGYGADEDEEQTEEAAAVDAEYEINAFKLYKKFVHQIDHLYYANDDNWDEIRFTNNDDIQKCNNRVHRRIQVCFCEDEDSKTPFECNENGEKSSAAKLFPFMNTMQWNKQGIDRQQLAGMGNVGETMGRNREALETLENMDPSELKDMEDYSFTMENPADQTGSNPMTVNVHFHYPKDYKERIENGAFGAKQAMQGDNLLYDAFDYEDDNAYDAFDDNLDFSMGEDGVYSDFYVNDNQYDDYFSGALDDDNDAEIESNYNYNDEYIDDAEYIDDDLEDYDYSQQYDNDEAYGDDDNNEHQFVYQADDDDEYDSVGSERLKDVDGSAAYINLAYDESIIDKDMRISIEKGDNQYVPYINPDVTGFNQKVRISWNTFWKLQLFAILCGVVLFVSISIYFNNPFKNLEWPALYLAQPPRYDNVKVFENNDDNIVDYDFDHENDENEQLKE